MKLLLLFSIDVIIQIGFIAIGLYHIRNNTLSNHGCAFLFAGTQSLMIFSLISFALIFSQVEVNLSTIALFGGIILLNFAIGYPIAFLGYKYILKPVIDMRRQSD